jgi:hypothetical protein
MAKTDIITIRLSPEDRLLYEAEAAYRKQSLSAYLRERFEKMESPSRGVPENVIQFSSQEQGMLLELLLLLRRIAGPEKVSMVQSELKRLKIPVWQEDNFFEKQKNTT